MANPQQTSDVFDQVSQPQSQATQNAPVATQQQQGDVFDQISGGTPAPDTSNTAQSEAVPDSLHIDPNASTGKGVLGTIEGNALNAAKGVNAIGAGIGEGVLDTLNGGANLLHIPHATLQARANELEQQNRENPTLNTIGNGAESVAEFLMGDEALKGLALSDRLLKTSRIAKLLESSPLLNRAVQIGVNAIRGGAVGGVEGTVKARENNDLPTSLEKGAVTGLATGAGTAALGALGTIPALYRGLTAAPKIQAAFQTGVRDVLDKVASDAGVPSSTAPAKSIRDVAGQVADAIEAKAKTAYQTLDDATDGRFQRFNDSLKNINRELRNTIGVNDEEDNRLLTQKAEIEAKQEQVFADAKARGVDPKLVDQANADWKKAQSLYDLDRQLKMASSGMRPELAAAGAKSSPEVLDPSKAFLRLNRLYDSGRLQQAVGQDQAQALLQHSDQAFVQNARTLALQKGAKAVGKVVGYGTPTAIGIGLGTHELFGNK